MPVVVASVSAEPHPQRAITGRCRGSVSYANPLGTSHGGRRSLVECLRYLPNALAPHRAERAPDAARRRIRDRSGIVRLGASSGPPRPSPALIAGRSPAALRTRGAAGLRTDSLGARRAAYATDGAMPRQRAFHPQFVSVPPVACATAPTAGERCPTRSVRPRGRTRTLESAARPQVARHTCRCIAI